LCASILHESDNTHLELLEEKTNKIELKIIYSVSDVRDLIRDTINSIMSLRRYFEKEDIIIYYTPPRSKKNYAKLSKLGTVIKERNITDEFRIIKGYGRFGEKFHALFVDSPNIIFLDSDTIINKDLFQLLWGSFDFSGRIAPSFLDININDWNKMFIERGKTPIPMINTGFMIFKNHTHNIIADEVLEYMSSDLTNPFPISNLKDQYALSLAVTGKKIRWMDNTIHAFLWKNELDGYVVHGSIPCISSDLKGLLKKMRMRINKYVTSLFS